MSINFELSKPVTCKPLTEWQRVNVELLGTQTRFVQGAQWRHRVIEAGDDSGEPLILIHGVGGHAETFSRNMHNLVRQGFHVFAIDALYHGYTDKQPYDDDKRYLYQVDAVVDLIDALGFDSVHIEGESMGATIAFHFGFAHPDRARKVILNTGFGHVKLQKTDFEPVKGDLGELASLSREVVVDPNRDAMRKRLEWVVAKPESMTDEMVDIRLAIYRDPEINASMRRVFRLDKDWTWELPYTEADLADYKPETLVLWTEHNPGDGPDYGEYIAGIIPGGKFYCIADAGHWPQWEKPEEHDAVLTEFCLNKPYTA
ncbi:alpha/beta hydrolase [Gordonia McavH-238-E]|uniref:alpha/beta fold hydrolase n=1 Tax=Gordonia sp. McavH-238-E TaxID=2917736 RepID=UPI001EF65373|nr:alpha/beta hydrolase [Gordonia sp. McavH-238-E]MCG7632919.1 alpha/beta hydrolase [Gordonia sp. McavH-238-E]